MSSCLCGSTKCDCEEECFCFEHDCKCPLCSLLPKMCPHCSLPIDVIADYACQVCTCCKKGETSSEAMSSSRTTESDESYDSKVPICCHCKLPIFIVESEKEEVKVGYCRCPQDQIENETVQSEHETSTSTSDHRQVLADRQMRKALSRRTRSQQSSWQAKKAKDKPLNSPEASILTITSDLHLAGQGSSYSACETSVSSVDANSDFNSPQRHTDETSTCNLSLLTNTSGVSIQHTPEASSFQTSGQMQANIPGREELFPSLPNPIPGPSASGEQRLPLPSGNRNQEMHRSILEQAPVERKEKIKKWFGTIKIAIKEGELPDAETAAKLDKLDKEQQQETGDSDEFPHYDSIPPPSRKVNDDTEHTDTDRSTSVSQSRIESDHIESESD